MPSCPQPLTGRDTRGEVSCATKSTPTPDRSGTWIVARVKCGRAEDGSHLQTIRTQGRDPSPRRAALEVSEVAYTSWACPMKRKTCTVRGLQQAGLPDVRRQRTDRDARRPCPSQECRPGLLRCPSGPDMMSPRSAPHRGVTWVGGRARTSPTTGSSLVTNSPGSAPDAEPPAGSGLGCDRARCARKERSR